MVRKHIQKRPYIFELSTKRTFTNIRLASRRSNPSLIYVSANGLTKASFSLRESRDCFRSFEFHSPTASRVPRGLMKTLMGLHSPPSSHCCRELAERAETHSREGRRMNERRERKPVERKLLSKDFFILSFDAIFSKVGKREPSVFRKEPPSSQPWKLIPHPLSPFTSRLVCLIKIFCISSR